MTPYARWQRLADTITEGTGVAVHLASATYPGGTSYSISCNLPDGTMLEVHDKWWSKNGDVWCGYQVHVAGVRDSIVRRAWKLTKKRSQVVADVQAALERAGRP